MCKFRIFFLLVCLALIFTILSPQTMASSNSSYTDQVTDNLTEKLAKQISNDNWNTTDIKMLTYIYDINDNIIGSYYEAYSQNEVIGYVITSNDKGLPPVLQFGDKYISEDFIENVNSGKKPYYFGGISYLYGNNIGEVVKDFENIKEQELSRLQKEKQTNSEMYQILKNRNLTDVERNIEVHKKSWDQLEVGQYGLLATEKTLGVTRVHQRASGINFPNSSCGPATGAMISNYYANSYNVFSSSYYGSDAKFINHLYSEMGTTLVGTTANQWGYGMEQHLNHNYNPTKFSRLNYSASGNWTRYEYSINKNRPVALRFDITSNPYAYSSYHFVAGIGYKYVGEEGYAGIKDPDGGSGNTGTHWIYWAANAKDMTMILTYYGTY